MRVVVQVVKSASVTVEGKITGQIDKGYLLYVGFKTNDDKDIIDRMINKLLKLRIFQDDNGLTNLSINDVNGEILAISQFTLYADTKKGNRPSFISAMKAEESKELYDYFIRKLEETFGHVEKGIFHSEMLVESINDGPFTILLDSEELFNK